MNRAIHMANLFLTTTLASTSAIGCQLEHAEPSECHDPEACGSRAPTATSPPSTPEMSILTWNVQWFQHPEHGPTDEALQFEIVADVIDETGASLVALQEVSEPDRFFDLLDRFPGYEGVISDHPWPQQLALLYRSHEFAHVASAPVFGLDDAGRPPLAIELQHDTGARALVVVVHAKAGSTPTDYAHRQRFARGLADQLAQSASNARMVLGDFNDRLTGSLVSERASPYEALLTDTGLVSPTAALEVGPEPSTIWGDTVDHILVDPACLATSGPPSADVLREELLGRYPEFVTEVSDHFPVRLQVADPRAWRLLERTEVP